MSASDDKHQQILQFLTTEHFTLQMARQATIAEANGRCSLFVGSVSSAVVALAFIGQMSGMSEGFFLFGLVLFPSLLFLGIFTFRRVLHTAAEDILYGRGINRIRHYYSEIAPEMRRYFIESVNDDTIGVLRGMGVTPNTSAWDLFQTSAGMIAVINGVLSAVFAGLLLRFVFPLSIYIVFGIGIAILIINLIVYRSILVKKFDDLEKNLDTLFPSEAPKNQKSPQK